ncbi:uncharacterized protein LOC110442215 [Mizuhopecten yessoensis]|uniref:uncharacterized protein LOC110442215 n=1 Tax=Mizuhopecten yessoensis TaxID=6573 RepID=UPI000B45B712|nr:uncharacterized protein LOC110442215 [Mizuhopecten yessoensis]
MEDLQTYRARIGLFRHRLASKRNVPPHKRASCRKREQKRRQDRTKLKKIRVGSATKLNPVASSGKMTLGITRRFAIIVIAILLMAGLTSGHMDTGQFFTENELHTNFPESHVIGKCFTLTLQQNYVIPSSMCDCLLGNAGVHAYNGNPRTPVSNDDTVIDMEVHAFTPSEGQPLQPFLEVGGDERSTINQSQRADQIQKMEIDIRKQHADMIKKIHGYISPMLSETWDLFRNGLTPHLTRRETHGSDVTFVGHICESLLRKDIIKHGEYSVLLEVVDSTDVRAGDIVRRATTAIKDIKLKISALKSEARSDHNTRLAQAEEDMFSELHESTRPTRSEHNTRFAKEEEDMFSELHESTRPKERTIDVDKRGKMIDQTENWIKWKRKQTTFIKTNAFSVAIDILKKTNLILIKGNCGDGKSVLAMEIMAWLMGDREEQCEAQHDTVNPRKKPLLLKELKSWDEIVSCHANLAIFIDDIFGYSSIYNEDLAWWKKISPFIVPVVEGHIVTDANCMILTVRNDVYAEHESLFCHEDVLSNGQCVVDLSRSQSLQTEEKKNILRLYLPKSVELSTDDETKILQSDLPFGFPECCRIFQSLEDMHDHPREYFIKPLVYIKHAIRDRFSKRKQSALLFLLLATGKVTESQLDPESSNAQEDELVKLAFKIYVSGHPIQSLGTKPEVQTKLDIKEGLKAMIGSLVKLESNTFTFYHDVVEDAVAILYGETTPRGFLRNVNITHLRYIVTLQGNENAIYIGDEYIECLYNRILDELKTRETKQYDILITLRLWDDENFVRNFIAWVGKQESVPNDFYFQWTTKECAPTIKKGFPAPNENNVNNYYSFFVFVAKSNKGFLLQKFIEQGKSNAIQMKLALDQACVSGSEKCALKLLENGITPDSNTWISVVKEGSLVLLNKLITFGIYANATTDDKTFNVENVNMLQLACLYEKEQIVLRLAQTFPILRKHRDKDNNSMFHHIAMTNNCDMFKKITTALFFESPDLMSLLRRDDRVTVLHVACKNQHPSFNGNRREMCMQIYKTCPTLISQRDNRGMHCLHDAACSGEVDCFMYLDNLVNEGKSETERQHYIETLLTSAGETVLHKASVNGQKTMCSHLLETCPSLISQRDNYGNHCLHKAAYSGDVDCFMYLDNLVNEGKSETVRLHYIETLLTSKGETVFHRASANGKKTMCSHLLETCPSLISQRDNYGNHCLHNAASSGDVDCFMYLDNLVNEGKSETDRLHYIETLLTSKGETVFHRASANGKKTMCSHLLETCPSLISQRDNYGNHCLHNAASSGDVDCFMYLDNLVNEGKSETERLHYIETLLTSAGETVLHLASQNGQKTMCSHLLETYPSLISQRDNYGNHCLHKAAFSGGVDCFMYLDNLVNEGKSETVRLHYIETLLTSAGETVLHLASQNGQKTMCSHLLETYPSLISQRDNYGNHCLHKAAFSGGVDCFMYLDNLVNEGKSETVRLHYIETLLTSAGETVLHLASQNGQKTMCSHLLETYPSLISQRDNYGNHCLHKAAFSGGVDCFMYLDNLVNEGKSETERLHYIETLLTSAGETVLHLASQNGQKTMCSHLLETYPSLISQRDNYGNHCLHKAAFSGGVDCFMYLDNLVNEGKSETERLHYIETLLTSAGETVLHLASQNGQKTMCSHLLETYPSLISQRDNYGNHCLHKAAFSGGVDCFMYLDNLVNEGKSETERLHYIETLLTSAGETVLHLASQNGQKTMCSHLLETYPSLISQRDNYGNHCLHKAAFSGGVDCFMYLDNLVNEGKSETERLHYIETLLTSAGETVLHLASQNGQKTMCSHLLETYPSLISQRDNYGNHCLHKAAFSGGVDCFMYLDNLVNEGKSETERLHYIETLLTSAGETVLHLASQNGQKTMCSHLLETYPSLISQRDNYGNHCLHKAAFSGGVDCFMYLDNLVNEGKSETERLHYIETLLTSAGETVLHLASQNGQKTMCSHLLETYPSLISQRDNYGNHCLHKAAFSGGVDCFMYLDNLVNEGKSETERLHYIETLLTSAGETVLHLASQNGQKTMCSHLLETYPSLISQRDNYGNHCLHKAAFSGGVDCFMYLDNLVNEGKSETERLHYIETLLTSAGETVLHLASQNGQKTMCSHLLETYPSLISQRDNYGNHCLHKAAFSGGVDCFMYLDNLVNEGKSETERLHYIETLLTSAGETVLHLASQNGQKTMCSHLLETYPSLISQRDNYGNHCLHKAAFSGGVDCFMYLDNLVNEGKSETERLHYIETLLTSAGETVLHLASQNGQKTMCSHLLETYPSLISQRDNYGNHCLHKAAFSGGVDCFMYLDNLVNEGKSETERLHYIETLLTSAGETVLHLASQNGQKTMCSHLLETYPSLISQRDNYGNHCLHKAAFSGGVDCFMYLDNLVNEGKSETERLHYIETLLTSKGETVLHRASLNGQKTMCTRLLETCPSLISQRDNYGNHCLHIAAFSGGVDCFMYLENLVNKGKSETERRHYMETLRNHFGQTVLHRARLNGQKTMCSHLTSKGETVLHRASLNGQKTMGTRLLETYPSLISQRDNFGNH